MLRELIASNHLPDYLVEMSDDLVTFRNRDNEEDAPAVELVRPFVDPEGFHDARAVAGGYDVYGLHEEWISWWNDSGCPELKSPRAAFIGCCKNKALRKPLRNL